MLSFPFVAISIVFIANFYFLINKMWELSKSRDTVFDLYEKKLDHKANKTFEDRFLIGLGVFLGFIPILISFYEAIMAIYCLDFGCCILVLNFIKALKMAAYGGLILAALNMCSAVLILFFDLIKHELNKKL